LQDKSRSKAKGLSINVNGQDFENFRLDYEKRTANVKSQEELLQTLKTGMAASEGHENGFLDQLKESKKAASVCSSTIEQAKIKIGFVKRELKDKEPKAKKAEKANQTVISELAAAKESVASLKVSNLKLIVFVGASRIDHV
jgi:structural maintenance of chromosome 2